MQRRRIAAPARPRAPGRPAGSGIGRGVSASAGTKQNRTQPDCRRVHQIGGAPWIVQRPRAPGRSCWRRAAVQMRAHLADYRAVLDVQRTAFADAVQRRHRPPASARWHRRSNRSPVPRQRRRSTGPVMTWSSVRSLPGTPISSEGVPGLGRQSVARQPAARHQRAVLQADRQRPAGTAQLAGEQDAAERSRWPSGGALPATGGGAVVPTTSMSPRSVCAGTHRAPVPSRRASAATIQSCAAGWHADRTGAGQVDVGDTEARQHDQPDRARRPGVERRHRLLRAVSGRPNMSVAPAPITRWPRHLPGLQRQARAAVVGAAADLGREAVAVADRHRARRRQVGREGDAAQHRIDRHLAGRRSLPAAERRGVGQVADADAVHADRASRRRSPPGRCPRRRTPRDRRGTRAGRSAAARRRASVRWSNDSRGGRRVEQRHVGAERADHEAPRVHREGRLAGDRDRRSSARRRRRCSGCCRVPAPCRAMSRDARSGIAAVRARGAIRRTSTVRFERVEWPAEPGRASPRAQVDRADAVAGAGGGSSGRPPAGGRTRRRAPAGR